MSELGRRTTRVTFWAGMTADVDLSAIRQMAIPVKGVSFDNPLRFLEVFANVEANDSELCQRLSRMNTWSWEFVERQFLPTIPGVEFSIGDNIPQPPFAWRDAAPGHLCISFTYNTNALFRILSSLSDAGRIPSDRVIPLLDDACLILTHIYRARSGFVLRNINNNLNMYLISKVIEFLVGKSTYDSECQELETTRAALMSALDMSFEQEQLSVRDKMSVSVGRGVSFIESKLRGGKISRSDLKSIQDTSHRYFGKEFAIDHRDKLFDMISNAGQSKARFTLAVILDDAAESVDDLLWLSALMRDFPFLEIDLVINTAQVSINFCSQYLNDVLNCSTLSCLGPWIGNRVAVTLVHCPFISYQAAYLPQKALEVIDAADAVYVKGANFFETCQLRHKNTFYAFVVYGPISRAYSGLDDFQAVFAYLPAGRTGYEHGHSLGPARTLIQTCDPTPVISEPPVRCQ